MFKLTIISKLKLFNTVLQLNCLLGALICKLPSICEIVGSQLIESSPGGGGGGGLGSDDFLSGVMRYDISYKCLACAPESRPYTEMLGEI